MNNIWWFVAVFWLTTGAIQEVPWLIFGSVFFFFLALAENNNRPS